MASGTLTTTRRRHTSLVAVTLRVVGAAAAATLFIDAYVHVHDAGFYDAVRSSVLSQGTLFRLQAVVALAVGLVLLIRPRRLWWAVALLVLGSAFGAVLLYRYVDVGALGPLPNMFEPTWALPGKLASAWAEGTGTALTTLGLVLSILAHRSKRRDAGHGQLQDGDRLEALGRSGQDLAA
jgi:hypothetical protein